MRGENMKLLTLKCLPHQRRIFQSSSFRTCSCCCR